MLPLGPSSVAASGPTGACSSIRPAVTNTSVSYVFADASDDITRLSLDVCEELMLRPRAARAITGVWQVRINRRESVNRLLHHVGVKS
jgi:hypothetical protein